MKAFGSSAPFVQIPRPPLSPPSGVEITDSWRWLNELLSRLPGGFLAVTGGIAGLLTGFLLGMVIYDEDEGNYFELIGAGVGAGGAMGALVGALASLLMDSITVGPGLYSEPLGAFWEAQSEARL